MSDHPVIYATLYGHQTDELNEAVRERLASNAARMVTQSTDWVADAMRQAYQRGVADGFAQGVAAEADREDAA